MICEDQVQILPIDDLETLVDEVVHQGRNNFVAALSDGRAEDDFLADERELRGMLYLHGYGGIAEAAADLAAGLGSNDEHEENACQKAPPQHGGLHSCQIPGVLKPSLFTPESFFPMTL